MQQLRGNLHLLKKLNQTRILDFIRKQGPVSKADIAEGIQLTFMAVSKLINELNEIGILRVQGVGKSSGGRKPILYDLNPDALYVIAIDLSSEDIKLELVNFHTELIAQRHIPAPPDKEPASYIKIIAESVRQMVADAKIDDTKLIGIGVSAPGPINTHSGEVLFPPNLPKWEIVPLQHLLQEALNIPVKVEKNANLSALGEKWFGVGSDVDNIIYVLLGDGIGGGIIIDGVLYKGNQFGAGEIGHVTIDHNGPRCNCGNYGCLEAMASSIAVVKRIQKELLLNGGKSHSYPANEQVNITAVMKALSHQDELTVRVIEEASYLLGIGLIGIINSFNPQKVIIGGNLPQAYPKMVEIAASVAKTRVIPVFRDKLNIVPAALGERSAIAGAAALILEEIFTLHLT
ncbi:ROK family transcriptional regulator [Lihuaxuella thermophila]|uniref:ROK family protein (Putative glucokinase) n=1 Tax=Lihuaxuella thermophila TaxID=1173111 RepID=A0A1H8G9W5_9BACL|nr:ROK family transcriptional regulator [Lihuaxuella thermophila]SEN40317.1 ROK family protein (putative glucokinase) [Lihuaxuella thermophila]